MSTNGVLVCPWRILSRNPCIAGTNERSRMESMLTTSIPNFTLMESAGVSRITCAVNGSTRALPPRPLWSSTPPAPAATAGRICDGVAALDPWLMELLWCS